MAWGYYHAVHRRGFFPIIESLPADKSTFVIPGLPHRLEMRCTQFMSAISDKESIAVYNRYSEMDARSYGEIVNSFLELEADYAVHWSEVIGQKTWLIGPVVLCNEELDERFCRGGDNSSIGKQELLNWLDGKRPGSVVYICFGTIGSLNNSLEQFRMIGTALEESNRCFIWVVRSLNLEGYDDWLNAFEQRTHTRQRGLVVREWAPQLLILNHPVVGGFLTHCGWNSTLEAICAGMPMITWPTFGNQFFNEKLIVEILRVGAAIRVTGEGPSFKKGRLIEAETIKSVIKTVTGEGVEADAMRKRVKELKMKVNSAVQEGGSSCID